MKMLNLGCGSRFHKDWINVNMNATGKGVIASNLLEGIPFESNTFNVVYHSHLLEHLSKTDGINLIKECYRVLKPGGIIRIATPDLEQIIKNYTRYLHESLGDDKIAQFKYDFTMIELLDQCVRTFKGGQLGQLYKKGEYPDPEFVYQRTGFKPQINLKQRIFKFSSLLPSISFNLKDIFLKLILGNEYRYYQLGKFRLSGEVHQWLYDRFSLKRLLSPNKFKQIKVCKATESKIPKWNSYNLDTNPDGIVYKPDSIFIEAAK
jgi:predicted SAM-dependent methyltransferase